MLFGARASDRLRQRRSPGGRFRRADTRPARNSCLFSDLAVPRRNRTSGEGQNGAGNPEGLRYCGAAVPDGFCASVLMSLKFSTVLNSMLNSPKFCQR